MPTRLFHTRAARQTIAAVAVATAALSISACQPTFGVAVTTPDPNAKVSTEVPSEPVTLTVATSENSGMSQALVNEFEKEYPTIKIKFEYTQSDDYNQNINLQLSSDDPPDVALLNLLGTTVSSGLMTDLDPYANAYGWNDELSKTGMDQWRSGMDGTTLGSGYLWAVPAGYSMVGVFYNKSLAAQIGMTGPPATLDEFYADLDKAKAAGIQPLQVGNLTGGAANIIEPIAASIDGPDTENAWAFGQSGATIDTPGNRQAASLVYKWENDGTMPKGSIGIDGATAQARFADGDGLFTVTGTWNTQTFEKKMGDNVGFFTFPPKKAGGASVSVGTSVAYGISAKSQHKDAAGVFLNFLTSPQASKIQASYGFMPDTSAGVPAPKPNTVYSDITASWQSVTADNGFIDYYSNTTSSMPDTLTQAGQNLMAGRWSVDEYLTALQADWEKVHG